MTVVLSMENVQGAEWGMAETMNAGVVGVLTTLRGRKQSKRPEVSWVCSAPTPQCHIMQWQTQA